MGFKDWWNGGYRSGAALPIVSPYAAPGNLATVLDPNDVYGPDFRPVLAVDRASAMSVPAIAKARNMLQSLIAARPLNAYRGMELLATQPSWTSRSDSGVPTMHRMSALLDDLFFEGVALWVIEDRLADGYPKNMAHVPFARWSMSEKGLEIDGEAVSNPQDFVLIDHPGWEGLLKVGSEKIREYHNLTKSAQARARNPIAAMEIHMTEGLEASDEEMLALKKKIIAAQNDGTSTFITPNGIEIKTHGDRATDFHESARNALRLDLAALCMVPATALEGSTEGSSLNYENEQGKRAELHDTIRFWAAPIEAWLSQDRVTPRTTRIAFDFSDYPTALQIRTTED
jgi:hypothetical protein